MILLLSSMACPSWGAHYVHTGAIQTVGTRTQIADGDFLRMENLTSLGVCATYQGLVELRIPSGDAGNRAMSILLAARMTGEQVVVTVKDENTTGNGFCIVHKLEFVPK